MTADQWFTDADVAAARKAFRAASGAAITRSGPDPMEAALAAVVPAKVAALQAEVEQLESDLRIAKAGEAFGNVAVAERNHAWAKITRREVQLAEANARAAKAEARLAAVAALIPDKGEFDDWDAIDPGDLLAALADPAVGVDATQGEGAS